jgi:hypothetical protein
MGACGGENSPSVGGRGGPPRDYAAGAEVATARAHL